MKITKLVIGIIMIILAVIILLQAIIQGFNGPTDFHILNGFAGIVMAGLYLATGIVYICMCGSESLGGDIAGLSMMLVSWILALLTCKIFTALQIWGWLALIIGVGFFIWHWRINHN